MTEMSQSEQDELIAKAVWKNDAVCEIPYEQLDSVVLDDAQPPCSAGE